MNNNQELTTLESQKDESYQPTLMDQVISNFHKLRKEDIKTIKLDRNKDGTESLEVNLVDGKTFDGTEYSSGISERSITQIPDFDSIEDRNHAIKEQYKQGKTQEKLARLFGLSQTTIHNILKK